MRILFDLVIKFLSFFPGELKKNGRIKPGIRVVAIFLSGVLIVSFLGLGAATCAFAIRLFVGTDTHAPAVVSTPQPATDTNASRIADTLNNEVTDTMPQNDTIDAVAKSKPSPHADTIIPAPPVNANKTTDTVKKHPATWNPVALLSFIKKEEQNKNTTITNVTVHVAYANGSMAVAKQIVSFLKQKGYNVSGDIGMVVTEHPLKGINLSVSNNGTMDVQVGGD